jgi:hypothetical protein
MCLGSPSAPSAPKPPPLAPAAPAPPPPPKPAPAPKQMQPVGSQPDLRVGGMKRESAGARNKVSGSNLRSTLNIGGNAGGLNS